ncbi:TPA: hypothetical protein R1782_001651 [Campylobacter coli]|nr:hypothetical protein [Campylobacter coli]
MIKNALILFFTLVSILSANEKPPPNPQTNLEEMKKIFTNLNDDIVDNGVCTWECRDVKDGYSTQITGFDFKNGTTFCKLFQDTDLNLDLKYDASRTNLACAKEINALTNEELKKYQNIKTDISVKSQISENLNNNNINFSKFLVSLATLNPNFIDREKTHYLGELALKEGVENFSIVNVIKNKNFNDWSIDFFNPKNQIQKPFKAEEYTYEKTNIVDGFNKNNMAYFSDLFLANEKIYQHLQILIFVLVGGFFVSSISAQKIQAYLENRGESEGKQPYLHKFYIPILMMATFFMPIPEANGLAHSTIMQNTIRYFAIKSSELADMASAVGGSTYMNKIYKSVGGVDVDGIKALVQEKTLNNYTYNTGQEIYRNTCSLRYESTLSSINNQTLSSLTDKQKEEYQHQFLLDKNNIAGTKRDISFNACIALENQIFSAGKKYNESIRKLQNITEYYDNQRLNNKLKGLDEYFATREKQLGWINSLLTPSSAMLAEIFMFEDEIEKVRGEDNTISNISKKNQENIKKSIKDGEIVDKDDDITESNVAWLAGQLVWMTLPGAGEVKNFFQGIGDKINNFIPKQGFLAKGIISIGSTLIAYPVTIYMYQELFNKIPLLVATTASLIVFSSFLITLIKYFYISPFVVAYSLATKRMSKIVEFLINGISIFLTPVLIVLFIYLSLFVHTLINEFFLYIATEQFTGIETSWNNIPTNLTIGAIIGFLTIFAKIASAIIMWQLIVKGHSWTLSLIGIDGKQGEVMAQSMEQTLNKRANIV